MSDPARLEFFRAMDREAYESNPRKSPWDDYDPPLLMLLYELAHHQAKLIASIHAGRPSAVTEHAADIANFCQIAAKQYGLKD